MKQANSRQSSFWGSALLGAICGGALVVIFTKAVPTMLTKTMSGVMGVMQSKMEACGCNPPEVCQKIMAASAIASEEE